MNFYPRPPRGGRLTICCDTCVTARISIHALREEGDFCKAVCASRPSISIHALREEGDLCKGREQGSEQISIHALREEGDGSFNAGPGKAPDISIHALREEGDNIRSER